MKFVLVILMLCLVQLIYSQDFRQDLLSIKAINNIQVPNEDAVIILDREQSWTDKDEKIILLPNIRSKVKYTYYFAKTFKSTVIKVLSEKGINELGKGEFSLKIQPDYLLKITYLYSSDLTTGSTTIQPENDIQLRIRIQKPDGSVIELDEDDIKESKQFGVKKLSYIIPDLKIGDVIYYETETAEYVPNQYPFNEKTILHSSYYPTIIRSFIIRLPASHVIYENSSPKGLYDYNIKILKDSQYVEHTWTNKKNHIIPKLNQVPYSFPERDRSELTVFTSFDKKFYVLPIEIPHEQWKFLTSQIYNNIFLSNPLDSIISINFLDSLFTTDLKISLKDSLISVVLIDSIYSYLLKNALQSSRRGIFPEKNNLDLYYQLHLLSSPDLTLLFFKILEKLNCNPKLILTSDKRVGRFETADEFTMPSFSWLNKLIIKIQKDTIERYYLFDKSTSLSYEFPWFVAGNNGLMLNKFGYDFITLPQKQDNNSYVNTEIHQIIIDSSLHPKENLSINYNGRYASEVRDELRIIDSVNVYSYVKDKFEKDAFRQVDSVLSVEYKDFATVSLSASGQSNLKVSSVDSLVSINLVSVIFKNFVESFVNDRLLDEFVMFGHPIKVNTIWYISIPANLHLYYLPNNESVHDENFSKNGSEIVYLSESNRIIIKCKLNIDVEQISKEKNSNFNAYLRKIRDLVNREIVFKLKY